MAPQKMDPQMVSSASTGTARYADGLGTCGRSPTGDQSGRRSLVRARPNVMSRPSASVTRNVT